MKLSAPVNSYPASSLNTHIHVHTRRTHKHTHAHSHTLALTQLSDLPACLPVFNFYDASKSAWRRRLATLGERPLTTFTLAPSHAILTQAFQSLIIFYIALTLNWAALLRQCQRRLRRRLSPLSFVRCHFVGLFVVRNSLFVFSALHF